MKIRASIKQRCQKCRFIKRNKRLLVICIKGKHKQRQG